MTPTLRLWVFAILLPLAVAVAAAPRVESAADPDPATTARRLLREPGPPAVASAAPAVSGRIIALHTPEQLEELLHRRPELIPGVYRTFALALDGDPALAGYLPALARQASRRLIETSEPDLDLFLARLLLDPERFVTAAEDRERALRLAATSLDDAVSPSARRRLLERLQELRGVGFDELEELAVAWGVVPRRSDARRLAAEPALYPEPPLGAIVGSIYSLSSELFTLAELEPWLRGLRALDSERRLLLAVDERMAAALAALIDPLGLNLIPTLGMPYSPWPRDPLTFLRTAEGRPAMLLRPNVQRGREDDALLGRTLAQGLPPELDALWGGLWWRQAELPFHNGQVLVTDQAVWVSVHSLEPRILELLGQPRVPVEGFAGPAGEAYLAAVGRAAVELEALYGRPARLVHPLPAPSDPDRAGSLHRLGGGAGLDLDSVLTLLPTPGGLVALVGDLAAGAELLATASPQELAAFTAAYHLRPAVEGSGAPLIAAQSLARAVAIDDFLDQLVVELSRYARVERLPLLWVPRHLERRPAAQDEGFLVGWQNVVLERRGELHRAEGFASLLPTGDQLAIAAYARAGYRLDLLPPLVPSVRRGGGYRCASQHLRRED